MLGSPADVDYFLWPRKDIEKIQCVLFSKWKDEDVPYKPLQVNTMSIIIHQNLNKENQFYIESYISWPYFFISCYKYFL